MEESLDDTAWSWSGSVNETHGLAARILALVNEILCEKVRSGIAALPSGQRAAGLAMGFTEWQT
ncbi:MAG: Glutamate Aspartate transport system permease protein GltJ (TC 3.A.1.3.4) [uncultured Caballeronia sp.]|nr:MAG: Glutamate Aspartate transport system permease protein GltJ (TC 3.A.1.3.4) [uncultured Caballeronia sp.]